MRGKYKYYNQYNFRRGINQEPENQEPGQVLDARNVWAPEGRLEQRPGRMLAAPAALGAASIASLASIYEDNSGASPAYTYSTTVLDVEGASIGDHILFSIPATSLDALDSYELVTGLIVRFATHFTGLYVEMNVASVLHKFEYWDGVDWKYLPTASQALETLQNYPYDPLVGTTSNKFIVNLTLPTTLTSTTEALLTGGGDSSTQYYFIRMALVDDGHTSLIGLGGPVNLSFTGSGTTTYLSTASADYLWAPPVTPVQYTSGKRYISLPPLKLVQNYTLRDFLSTDSVARSSSISENFYDTAVVAEFDKAYVVCPGTEAVVFDVDNNVALAEVESDEAYVGSGASYDPEAVAQLPTWPNSQFVYWFQGHLWAAKLDGAPFTIRWSAPNDAYKVWPATNFAFVADDDNSPITALSSLNEHLIVFKNDSIWQMVDVGLNEIGQRVFQPVKVVSGVGCVAQRSIARTPAGLVFLAEDGVYLFDGTPNVKAISEPVNDQIAKINSAHRWQASAIHWRTKNAYLLSVAIDGSETNNFVFVWDYFNNAWWFWDGFNAQGLFTDEDALDNEVAYFQTQYGVIYQFGPSAEEFGTAPDVYVLTQRQAFGDFSSKTAREVRVNASNAVDSLTVEVMGNDESSGTSGTMAFSDVTEDEYGTGVFGTATFGTRRRRDRRLMFRKGGEWFTIKVSNSAAGRPLELHRISLGTDKLGYR